MAGELEGAAYSLVVALDALIEEPRGAAVVAALDQAGAAVRELDDRWLAGELRMLIDAMEDCRLAGRSSPRASPCAARSWWRSWNGSCGRAAPGHARDRPRRPALPSGPRPALRHGAGAGVVRTGETITAQETAARLSPLVAGCGTARLLRPA